MSRYEALTDHLRNSSDDVVVLTFEELDELIGGLPPSARKHAPWWGNSKKPSSQSRYWMQAGRLARPNMESSSISFRRMEVVQVPMSSRPPKQTGEAIGVRTSRPAELTASNDHVRTTITYEWQHAGVATLVRDKLQLPILPPRPGVYRFVIAHSRGTSSTYVGETDNLFRRMGNYRNPGPSQQTNQRLSALLLSVVNDGGSVTIDVVTAGLLGGDTIDLSIRAGRCLIESTALCELGRRGSAVENL